MTSFVMKGFKSLASKETYNGQNRQNKKELELKG